MSNRTGEMSVNQTGKPIVSKYTFSNTAWAEMC